MMRQVYYIIVGSCHIFSPITYNAIGMPMYAFTITIVRQLVLYIPFLLLFNYLFGYRGLIHAQAAEEMLCVVFSVFLLRRSLKKMEEKA